MQLDECVIYQSHQLNWDISKILQNGSSLSEALTVFFWFKSNAFYYGHLNISSTNQIVFYVIKSNRLFGWKNALKPEKVSASRDIRNTKIPFFEPLSLWQRRPINPKHKASAKFRLSDYFSQVFLGTNLLTNQKRRMNSFVGYAPSAWSKIWA